MSAISLLVGLVAISATIASTHVVTWNTSVATVRSSFLSMHIACMDPQDPVVRCICNKMHDEGLKTSFCCDMTPFLSGPRQCLVDIADMSRWPESASFVPVWHTECKARVQADCHIHGAMDWLREESERRHNETMQALNREAERRHNQTMLAHQTTQESVAKQSIETAKTIGALESTKEALKGARDSFEQFPTMLEDALKKRVLKPFEEAVDDFMGLKANWVEMMDAHHRAIDQRDAAHAAVVDVHLNTSRELDGMRRSMSLLPLVWNVSLATYAMAYEHAARLDRVNQTLSGVGDNVTLARADIGDLSNVTKSGFVGVNATVNATAQLTIDIVLAEARTIRQQLDQLLVLGGQLVFWVAVFAVSLLIRGLASLVSSCVRCCGMCCCCRVRRERISYDEVKSESTTSVSPPPRVAPEATTTGATAPVVYLGATTGLNTRAHHGMCMIAGCKHPMRYSAPPQPAN